MDGSDDLAFRVNFGGDGVAKLGERITNKLKEFMGDYTDDTLVEYVIVLLKNGRRKVEARNELNVFLGDDSDSFVSWLWDHLGSNLDLYVQHGESRADEGIHSEALSEEKIVKEKYALDLEADREKNDTLNSNRRIRESKSYVRSNDGLTRIQRDEDHKVTHSKQSSRELTLRKRSCHDEHRQDKRYKSSDTKMNGTRRLLQSAVRDAVGTSRTSSSTLISATEPSLKRLRSTVEDSTTRIRSVSRMPNTLAVAIRAVADAAEDVKRVKYQSNVFDRIGRSNAVNRIVPEQPVEASIQEKITDDYVLESDGGDNDDYVVGIDNNDTSESCTPKKGDDDLVMMQYRSDDSAAVVPDDNSGNTANISVNVNTWKSPPSHDGDQKEALDMKENKALHAVADTPKEPQKTMPSTSGLHPTGRPTEDTDSRTIFVSNVHFAATKDSLSRHFNKFGDVLKVVIVTDAATGQPKGSAYVEFMRKESAEHALSLDGTSFLSRILKVLKKSEVGQEVAAMTWAPRVSQFVGARFARRGVPNIYRPRLPIQGGARSMQWKRDAQPSPSHNTNPVPSPTSRSLTYVRVETKTNVN